MTAAVQQEPPHPGTSATSPQRSRGRARQTTTQRHQDEPAEFTEVNKAFYCNKCEIWLNGHAQKMDHFTGKKHRDRTTRSQRQEERRTALADDPSPEREPTR
jgi:hypothetical protein